MKIAEALVLRKHLEAKVKQLEPLKLAGENGAYEMEIQRVKVADDVDEARIKVPRIDIKSVTADYDRYAKALRQLDVKIQQANWNYDVDFDESVLEDEPKK